MHDHNLIGWKIHAFVGVGDGRIVPLGDFFEENSGERFRSEVQSGGHAGNVVGRNVGAEHGGKVQDVYPALVMECLDLLVVHGAIRGSEIHGAFGNLLDAGTGTDGLVINFNIGILLVKFIEPFRINRVRESCARSVDEQWVLRGPNYGAQGQDSCTQSCNSLHSYSSPSINLDSLMIAVWGLQVTELLQGLGSLFNKINIALKCLLIH